MRIGVCIDGYNVYYGGRHQLGKTPGWRWLDLRSLALTLITERRGWTGATLHQEEKGTDVNLATHLLTDVMNKTVDPAAVISKDSDLKLPIHRVRQVVPMGQVNPRVDRFAGDLTGAPADGAGGHWWRKLTPSDFRDHQLPDPAGPPHDSSTQTLVGSE